MSINQLVENLLGFGNKLNNDPGLKQGTAFNSMQKQIIDQTLPALPLMEETTSWQTVVVSRALLQEIMI